MAIARTPTLLPLDRFAQILGLNPIAFNGAYAPNSPAYIYYEEDTCARTWYQEPWHYMQQVSREDVGLRIAEAEADLARELGWPIAPQWVEQDVRNFPRHYRPDVYRIGGGDVRAQRVGIKAMYGKIITTGQRNTDLIDTATTGALELQYLDNDGDGFAETAQVAVTTTLTDVREINVYFQGWNAAPEWQIRPPRSENIAGGTYTATFWTWQFIDPDLWYAFPTTSPPPPIDATAAANLVTSVDVFRVWTDTEQASASFMWEPRPRNLLVTTTPCSCGGTGCPACQYTTQSGCLHVRDTENGIVIPTPAEYDADDARWEQVAYSCSRDPDIVSMYYLCGNQGQRYLSGLSDDPLSQYWAETVTWLTAARLERPICDCGVISERYQDLREDLSHVGEISYTVPFDVLNNPFGTRKGEVKAWRRVANATNKVPVNVALV